MTPPKDQPLLRLPNELNRKNLRSARAALEKFQTDTTTTLETATKASLKDSHDPAATVASMDAVLAKAQNLKRKLESLYEEEMALHRHQKARLDHYRTCMRSLVWRM